MKLFFVLLFVAFAPVAFSHSGETDSRGCHEDKTVNDHHCHEEKAQKNSAQIAKEQIREGLEKKPGLKHYLTKRGAGQIFEEEKPQSTESHHDEFNETHPQSEEPPSVVAASSSKASPSPRRNIAQNVGQEVDFSQGTMVFYNKHCKNPSKCIKVPVFTNLKNVMFEYSIRPKE